MDIAPISKRYSLLRHLGGETHYQLAGPEGADTVVLVPGASLPLAVWEPLMAPLLEAGLQVLRYDLPGRGHSSPLHIKAGLDADGLQLQALLDGLNLQRPLHLVGLASGALSVAAYVQQQRQRVARVALIAPDGVKTLSFGEKLFVAPILGELLGATLARRLMLKRILKYSARTEVRAFLQELMRYALQGATYQKSLLAYVRALPLHEGPRYYRQLAQTGIATCVICGGDDEVNPVHTMAPLQELLGREAVHVLEGVGHLPQVEEPRRVADLLLRHFKAPAHDRGARE